jgi:hypothetical protein
MEKLGKERFKAAELFRKYENAIGITDSDERWKDNPESARGHLSIVAAFRDTPAEYHKKMK